MTERISTSDAGACAPTHEQPKRPTAKAPVEGLDTRHALTVNLPAPGEPNYIIEYAA